MCICKQVALCGKQTHPRDVRILAAQGLEKLCRGPKALEHEQELRSSLGTLQSGAKADVVVSRHLQQGLDAMTAVHENIEKEKRKKEAMERKLKEQEDKGSITANEVRGPPTIMSCT